MCHVLCKIWPFVFLGFLHRFQWNEILFQYVNDTWFLSLTVSPYLWPTWGGRRVVPLPRFRKPETHAQRQSMDTQMSLKGRFPHHSRVCSAVCLFWVFLGGFFWVSTKFLLEYKKTVLINYFLSNFPPWGPKEKNKTKTFTHHVLLVFVFF